MLVLERSSAFGVVKITPIRLQAIAANLICGSAALSAQHIIESVNIMICRRGPQLRRFLFKNRCVLLLNTSHVKSTFVYLIVDMKALNASLRQMLKKLSEKTNTSYDQWSHQF